MPLLFLAFTVLPFLELFLLIRIGRLAGTGSTVAFVVVMAFLGASLAKTQGRKVLLEWQEALASGRVPAEGVLGGVLILLGGLLLIMPGIITDVLGLLCLLPPTRRAIARVLARYLEKRVAAGQVQVVQMHDFGFPGATRRPQQSGRPLRSDVIDTEGEEISNEPSKR